MAPRSEKWTELSKVLKPLGSKVDPDSDDLPEFDLHDVIIRDQEGNIISLLLAEDDSPVVITGQLRYSSKLAKHFKSKPEKSTPIIYSNIESYAYDDETKLWALTPAGWLTIVSVATEYEPVFKQIQEAIQLWYYIQDNRKKQWTMKEWARGFKSENKSKMTTEKAEKCFATHADFIFPEMKKQRSSWTSTTIFKFMKEAAPLAAETRGEVKKITTSELPTMDPESATERRGTKQESEQVYRDDTRNTSLSKEAILPTNSRSNGGIIWKLIHSKCKRWTLDEATMLLYAHFDFESEKVAQNYLFYQAESLVRYMKQTKFSKSPLYKALVDSDLSSQVNIKMAKIALRLRDSKNTAMLINDLDAHSSTDEDMTPVISRLRPRAGGAVKRYTGNVDRISDLMDTSYPIGSKRKKLLDDDDDDEDVKRQDGTSEDHQERLPFRGKNSDGNLSMTKEYQIDSSLIDAEGVWRCDHIDCLHVVYAADTELGEEMVKMHMEDHEEPEVDIVMREMHATHLPVENLLKRIREFAVVRNLTNSANESGGLQEQPIRNLFP